MDNYYEKCIEDIEKSISLGDMEIALVIVQKELSMPYVPEPYFSKFQEYLNDIVVDKKPRSQFFEDLEDIEVALVGNEALQQKAILSLERINLRQDLDWLQQILLSDQYIDGIKKQILLFMMEQEIQGTFDVYINRKTQSYTIEEIKHPMDTAAYQTAHEELRNLLESENPSMLLLCIGELDFLALQSFPELFKGISAREVVDRVASYLG